VKARRSKHNPEGLNLFDSHCHLTDNQFAGDLKLVVKNAFQVGVREILVASQNIPDSKEAISLCSGFEGLHCSIGVHPHEADGFRSVDITTLKELCIEPSVRAIGEIGLDFFRNISSRSSQEMAFHAQIDVAKTMDLPMVLHIRDAAGRARSILEEHEYYKGVLHCFSGDRKMAEWAAEKGLYVSFAGNLTYGEPRLTESAKTVPQDRLMVETDAPFLAPGPKRGKRNEPAYLPLTVSVLAELLGVTPREAGDLTRQNTRRCFDT
jgi:TatD DNase family protein